MVTINEMFYGNGGYQATNSKAANYVDTASVSTRYIPQGLAYFNALIEPVKTSSVTSSSTGDVYDDIVIAELSLYLADMEYDKIHIDPDTGDVENRHYVVAERLVLQRYGIRDNKFGMVVLPKYGVQEQAYGDLYVSTSSY